MYCYHCGYELDEKRVEAKAPTRETEASSFKDGTAVSYVCPRCGHLIHAGSDETDIKSLSRASHAEIQRGRNTFAYGMGATCLAVIGLILAGIFLRLSFKPGLQNQLILTCPEFFVSMTLFVVGGIALIYGLISVFIGEKKVRHYERLLREIHTATFTQ
jgi:hypothetical protein